MNKNDAAWKAKFPEIRTGFNNASPRGIASGLDNQPVFDHLDKKMTNPDNKM
jgi:hypothetical protein